MSMREMRHLVGMALLLGGCVPVAWAQEQKEQKPVQLLTFRLHGNRFLPAEITVPEGRYSVTLINTYVRGEIELSWKDDRNAQVSAKKLPKSSPRGQMMVQLTPGKHVLQVVGKPEWKCDVTVVKDK